MKPIIYILTILLTLTIATALNQTEYNEIESIIQDVVNDRVPTFSDIRNLITDNCKNTNTEYQNITYENPYVTINKNGTTNLVFITELREALRQELPYEFANIQAELDTRILPRLEEMNKLEHKILELEGEKSASTTRLAACNDAKDIIEQSPQLELETIKRERLTAIAMIIILTLVLIFTNIEDIKRKLKK